MNELTLSTIKQRNTLRDETMKVTNLNQKGEKIDLEKVVLSDQMKKQLIEILER